MIEWRFDTGDRLAHEVALFICYELDEACEMEAAKASADRAEEKEISAFMEYLGQLDQNHDFSFFMIRPAPRSLERRER